VQAGHHEARASGLVEPAHGISRDGGGVMVEWRIAGPLIDELRNGGTEGATVGIVSDNRDFDGPNCCITVADEWTNWADKAFYGDSVIDCLNAAIAARKASA
jgi:hypothetical protein